MYKKGSFEQVTKFSKHALSEKDCLLVYLELQTFVYHELQIWHHTGALGGNEIRTFIVLREWGM